MTLSPKALGPTRGLSAVLGRNALDEPGDCGQARPAINDTEAGNCQEAIRSRCNIDVPLGVYMSVLFMKLLR
jgi:hypothetical protein